MTRWNQQGSDINSFILPQSFSIENYQKLFLTLYEKCQWSINNTIKIFHYLLENRSTNLNIYSLKKERKWLIDIIIEKILGKELFFKNILKEVNTIDLDLFSNYPEITTQISDKLIKQYETNGFIEDQRKLSLIRYQLMNENLFNQFLFLFKKTSSDVNQRKENYLLFIHCAISSNNQNFIKNVLEFVEKRFTNEQIIVIEYFLSNLSSFNKIFNIEYLPNYFHLIESIFNKAINHLQQSNNTLQIIISYGLFLLKSVENYPKKEQKQKIQQFATNIIKR